MNTVINALVSCGKWLWASVVKPVLVDVGAALLRAATASLLEAAARIVGDFVAGLARWAQARKDHGEDERSLTATATTVIVDSLSGVAASLQAKRDELENAEDLMAALAAAFATSPLPVAAS